MNNIWHPYYKKLEKNGYLELYCLEYDVKLEHIKVLIKNDDYDEYYLYAGNVQYYGFTQEDSLRPKSFEYSSDIDKQDRPFYYFYEVEKSTLIEQLVKNSDGLVSAERLKHFVVRVYEGLFDIVTRNTEVRIVEIKREF